MMPNGEISGFRDKAYSAWRRHKTAKERIGCLDQDWIEYCQDCMTPLALVETMLDIGQGDTKPTTITKALADMADLPAFLVYYQVEGEIKRGEVANGKIIGFKVRRITPYPSQLEQMTSEEWLSILRDLKPCKCPRW